MKATRQRQAKARREAEQKRQEIIRVANAKPDNNESENTNGRPHPST
jgi:hypothetical protein